MTNLNLIGLGITTVDKINHLYIFVPVNLHSLMQLENVIQEIRAFNRSYVDFIGLLNAGGYHSKYTLSETRVLLEINETSGIQASQVMLKIHIDKSYLSRILKRLEKDGLISRKRSEHDSRAVILSLTQQGKSELEKINYAASDLVKVQIETLDASRCEQLVAHMKAIMELLNLSNK